MSKKKKQNWDRPEYGIKENTLEKQIAAKNIWNKTTPNQKCLTLSRKISKLKKTKQLGFKEKYFNILYIKLN